MRTTTVSAPSRTKTRWRASAPAFLAGVAYAATDELHQHFVAGRHASPIDVGIDAVGVALGVLAWRRVVGAR